MRISFDVTIRTKPLFGEDDEDTLSVIRGPLTIECTFQVHVLQRFTGRKLRTFTFQACDPSGDEALRKALEMFLNNDYSTDRDERILWDDGGPSFRESIEGKPEFIVDHLPEDIRYALLQILDLKTNAQLKLDLNGHY